MSAGAAFALASLDALGIEIQLRGCEIWIRPRGAAPAGLRELLRNERSGAVGILREAAEAGEPPVVVLRSEPEPGTHSPQPRDSLGSCFSCRGTRRWRLRRLSTGLSGGWICARCHPPTPSRDRIEWTGTGEGEA